MSASQKKKRKIEEENRIFQDKWTTEYFFIQQNGKDAPTCLICGENVSVMKEYNLKRHYDTKHKDGACGKLKGDERVEKIKKLKSALNNQQNLFPRLRNQGENIVRASYAVSYQIAKGMKAYSEGDFVKNCLNDVASVLCPEKATEFEKISLSRWTVARRIDDMAEDISETLKKKTSKFVAWSFATDESTDRRDTAQLAIFVKGVDKDLNESEEMLSLQSMKDTTTGEDIFEEVNKSFNQFDLDWSTLCGMATDGAPAMSGQAIGLVGQMKSALSRKELDPDDFIVFHCIIHQENLSAKALQYKHVIGPVVRTINFIKARGLNHRQFQQFLDELESDHHDLVYFTEVRWLSKGKMLKRFYDLREEIKLFLEMKGNPMEELDDKLWLCDLAFIIDVTAHMNALNVKLQKKGQYANEMYGHIKAFQNKLKLWKRQMHDQDLTNFTTVEETGLCRGKQREYCDQLQKLLDEFNTRFDDFKKHDESFKIFAAPFHADVDDAPREIQMELIELQEREDLKARYHDITDIGEFYRKHLSAELFPRLRKFVAKRMAMFGSTYVCEQFFSKMGFMKSPFRAMLTDEHLENGLRVACSSFEPNLNKIVKDKHQYHPSH